MALLVPIGAQENQEPRDGESWPFVVILQQTPLQVQMVMPTVCDSIPFCFEQLSSHVSVRACVCVSVSACLPCVKERLQGLNVPLNSSGVRGEYAVVASRVPQGSLRSSSLWLA